jgi:hypothetical protein
MNSPRRVILSAAKNPAGFTHAVALLDSSLALRMTNREFIGSTAKMTK